MNARQAAQLAAQIALRVAGIAIGKYLLIAAAIGGVIALLAVMLIIPALSNQQTLQQQAGGGDCTPTSTVGAIPEAPSNVLDEQIANAKAIDETAQKLGLSGQATKITIIAAIGESDLLNLNYGDAAGPDSAGILQQRPSQGWGTREQVRTPTYAATSFLIGQKHDRKGGLVSIPGWQLMEPTIAINKVQINADPLHYMRAYSRADAIISKAGIDVSRDGSNDGGDGDVVTVDNPQDGDGASADACGTITAGSTKAGDDYPDKDKVPPPGVYVVDDWNYFLGECTSFVAWRINRDAGSTKPPYKYSGANGNFLNGNGAQWRDAWLKRGWKVSQTPVAGSVAWWDAGGGPGIGYAGHVAYVHEVTADGKVIIEEYNNAGHDPPGRKYTKRPQPVDPSEVNAFLYPPGK